jgi:hypothetical protein
MQKRSQSDRDAEESDEAFSPAKRSRPGDEKALVVSKNTSTAIVAKDNEVQKSLY